MSSAFFLKKNKDGKSILEDIFSLYDVSHNGHLPSARKLKVFPFYLFLR